MAVSNRLTHKEVAAAKATGKLYRLPDGQGLYLLIKPGGQKHWRLNFSFQGKRREYAIGQFPQISLSAARQEAIEARRLIAQGIDPVRHRQERQRQALEASENVFGSLAEQWFVVRKAEWSAGHRVSIRQRLDNYVLPAFGATPVDQMDPVSILPVLRMIEDQGKVETAKRIRVIISQIFRFGISSGKATRDHAADLTDAMRKVEPTPMAAITDPEKVGGLMRSLAGYDGHYTTRIALLFIAHTAGRPNEIRAAEWSEINFIACQWRIPVERMKGRRSHVVPLSTQMMKLLREMHRFTGHGRFLFPSLRSDLRPMSENTLNAALRRLGYAKEQHTAHGFRSTLSTLLNEAGQDPDLVEMCLAHKKPGSKVRAIYDRSERIKERAQLMQFYSDLLDSLQQGQSFEEACSGA